MFAAASSSASSRGSRKAIAAPAPPTSVFAGLILAQQEQQGKQEYLYHCANDDCNFCSANNKSLLVACRCHEVFHCTKQCQLAHWKGGHKSACSAASPAVVVPAPDAVDGRGSVGAIGCYQEEGKHEEEGWIKDRDYDQ